MRFRLCTTKQCAESELPICFYTFSFRQRVRGGSYAMVRSTKRARERVVGCISDAIALNRVAVAGDATGLTRRRSAILVD